MPKVLIIEDEKAMADLISTKFKVEGFEVDYSDSFKEAYQKVTNPANSFDLILTDYLLPEGNLFDFLTQIRALEDNHDTPVIAMSNYIEDINQEKLRLLKVDDIIVKYKVVPAQMVERAKQLLSERSLHG